MINVYPLRNKQQEDSVDYIQHEHFEDIRLPDWDPTQMLMAHDEQLSLGNLINFENLTDYTVNIKR